MLSEIDKLIVNYYTYSLVTEFVSIILRILHNILCIVTVVVWIDCDKFIIIGAGKSYVMKLVLMYVSALMFSMSRCNII